VPRASGHTSIFRGTPILHSRGVCHHDPSSLPSFFCGSLPILIVGLFKSRISVESSALPLRRWIRARLFYACKIALLLPITFLFSVYFSAPLHPLTSFPGFLLQSCLFAQFAVITFHWAALDCNLRSLAEPVRVGRPSHNFLERNSTELICTEGHGVLSIPEMERSSFQSIGWFPRDHAQAFNAAGN